MAGLYDCTPPVMTSSTFFRVVYKGKRSSSPCSPTKSSERFMLLTQEEKMMSFSLPGYRVRTLQTCQPSIGVGRKGCPTPA